MPAVVVIPTYQEADNIGPLIQVIRRVLPGAVVLVVDDRSPDGTAERARMAGARVIERVGARGLGPAYRDGFLEALNQGYDPIFQMDADFSHDPGDLVRLDSGADLTIGSRYVPGGGTENWELSRRLLSRFGSFYADLWLGSGRGGYRLADWTGGFKCWRAGVLARISVETLGSTGYAFQIETTFRALQLGVRVAEVPILFTERRSGASKMNQNIALEAAFTVPRLRWRGY